MQQVTLPTSKREKKYKVTCTIMKDANFTRKKKLKALLLQIKFWDISCITGFSHPAPQISHLRTKARHKTHFLLTIFSLRYLADHLNGYTTSHLNTACHYALPSHGKRDSGRPPRAPRQRITRCQRCLCPQHCEGSEALLPTCTAVPQTSSAKPVSSYGHKNTAKHWEVK